MFDLLGGDVGDLDASGALRSAAELRSLADLAEARLLQVAAHYADLHPQPSARHNPHGELPGAERTKTYGGEGCPVVAEFAAAELGAVLGVSSGTAAQLIGDALGLRHRLPLTWARVVAGEVQAWRARQVAAACWPLSEAAAAVVDARVVDCLQELTAYRLSKIVKAAVMDADPELAKREAERAARARGVWVGQSDDHGTKTMTVRAAAGDIIRFNARLNQIADLLATHGDPDSKDLRRAKAIGYLANADPTSASSQPSGGSLATVYVHLSDEALISGLGVIRVGETRTTQAAGEVGPLLASRLSDLLGDSRLVDKIVVKPVIDLAEHISVDAYEIPNRIRERVLLRYPTCIFPWCNRPATTSIDLDHIAPYQLGPPGQTSTENLAPCCRLHHRLKTHGGWTCRRLADGAVEWTTPHGYVLRVDHTGTHLITTPLPRPRGATATRPDSPDHDSQAA